MRLHSDWLPDAVTHEVNIDRGDAECPKRYTQGKPIHRALVLFFFKSGKIMNFLNKAIDLVTLLLSSEIATLCEHCFER